MSTRKKPATKPVSVSAGNLPLVLRLRPVIELSDDQLLKLCAVNGDLRIERTREGDLEIMPPTNSETGKTNFNLTGDFAIWVRQDGTGAGFDSSAGFTLPDGAVRSPDLSWIREERWKALPREARRKFAPICPDFVLELRSPSDPLSYVQAKMQEYMENGARLGWLIDPVEQRVYVYRPGAPVEQLDRPETLSGEPVLPGFTLDLRVVWEG